MFGASPLYRNLPYYQQPLYSLPGYSSYNNQRTVDLDRARDLAAQRARRARWLLDEYDDDDDYDTYQLSPHERMYLNAHKNRMLMEQERHRREREEAEAKRRALQEQYWQQGLDRRQKEDETARKRIEEERERRRLHQVFHSLSDFQVSIDKSKQQQRERDRLSSPARSIPISTTDARVPSPKPEERPASPQQSPSVPQYDEKHVRAVTVLQHHFRIHQSIRNINSIAAEFNDLRRGFTYPSIISLQKPSSPISTDVIDITTVSPSSIAHGSTDVESMENAPKLVFNSTNYGLHAYNEALDKLLVKLDGVESWGDQSVRTKRRAVVKQIEEEQAFVDRFWRTSWLSHLRQQGEWAEGDLPVDG